MRRAWTVFAKVWHALSDRLNRGTELLLFAIGFGMALLAGVQVISRYLLNHSLFWSEEVGRICLVWITFLGASAAYKRRAHVAVDFLVARCANPLRRFWGGLVLLISLVFFGILMAYGVAFADFVSGQKTAALGLPLTVLYLVIPLSGGLFFVHGVSHLLQMLSPDEGAR